MRIIYYWSNGTWCDEDEMSREFTPLNANYFVTTVADHLTADQINRIIDDLVSEV